MNQNEYVGVEQFGGPEKLKLMADQPAALKPGELRVSIRAIGVNRADILLRAGRYHVKDLPAVPGFEASGVVIESRGKAPVGARVLIFDRGHGLYRREAVVSESLVVTLPAGISFEDAACLPVNGLTALYCLDSLLALKEGETLLVTAAASGVGLATIQLAKNRGLRVIAAASNNEKLEFARGAGAEYFVNYQQSDLEAEVRRITQTQGVHGAMDIIGGAYFRPTLRSLSSFGKLVSMANVTTEDSTMNTRDFYPINASIHGFQLGALLSSGRWDPKPALEGLIRDVVAGRYRPRVHRVFKLNEANLAHIELEGRSVIGKILLLNEENL